MNPLTAPKPLSIEIPECPVLVWHGCYDESWKGIITDAAFAHPAKMSRNLLRRIITHGFERQWWTQNCILGDPFGGVGTTAIEGTYAGLRVVSNELEAKFVALAASNFELHRSAWETLGRVMPVFHQGDSRRFDQIMDGIVTSPPFTMASPNGGGGINKNGYSGKHGTSMGVHYQGGGGDREPDNIEVCPAGELEAAITSPPYDTIAAGAGGLNHLAAREEGQQSGRARGPSQAADTRYGDSQGQISGTGNGTLDAAILSPPYSQGLGHGGGKEQEKMYIEKGLVAQATTQYGASDGQITQTTEGALDAALTSPPWEDNSEGHIGAKKWGDPKKAAAVLAASATSKAHSNSAEARERQFARDADKTYGDSPGQIGKERKESYWQAMRQVYEALYRSLKPGGIAAIVVKDYVRDKKRVRLCDDTLRLLAWIGYEPVERIHAMLVTETTHGDLFAGQVKTKKERKSFFRRLHEAKLPENDERRIDFEEVIVVRKP